MTQPDLPAEILEAQKYAADAVAAGRQILAAEEAAGRGDTPKVRRLRVAITAVERHAANPPTHNLPELS